MPEVDLTFDLPLLVISINTQDEKQQDLALDYWDHDLDEHGKPRWRYAVATLSKRQGIANSLIARYVESVCHAVSKANTCNTCGGFLPVTSRATLTGRFYRQACQPCTDAAKADAAQYAETVRLRAEQASTRRAEWISQSYPISPDDEDDQYLVLDCDLEALLTLRALLSKAVDGVVPALGNIIGEPVAADPAWLQGQTLSLWSDAVLRPHPQTSADTFEWEEDADGHLSAPRYRPALVKWYAPGQGSLAVRAQSMLDRAEEFLENAWDPTWVTSATDLARNIIVAEARRYYEWAISAHRLPPLHGGDQSGRLDRILSCASDSFSLGQCYAVIWSIAKDGGAVTQRHSGMPRQDATTHTLNRIEAYVTKALEKGWELSCFQELRELPLATTTKALFAVLGLQSMSATVDEARLAAESRLDAAARLQRTIINGVSDAQYDLVTSTIDALGEAATASVDQGKFPGLPAAITTRVLTNFSHVAETAIDAGCSRPDALRSAYFGLQHVAILPTAALNGPAITRRCQQYVEQALQGTLDADFVLADFERAAWPEREPSDDLPF